MKIPRDLSSEDLIKCFSSLPLYYNLAPNEIIVPAELLEREFLDLAETEGINDIAELNKILDRAVNLKNFLKADKRVDAIASIKSSPDNLPKR